VPVYFSCGAKLMGMENVSVSQPNGCGREWEGAMDFSTGVVLLGWLQADNKIDVAINSVAPFFIA